MNSQYPYRPPITCVRCGKELKSLDPGTKDPYGMVEGGVVGVLYSPYRSQHDGTVFQIGVCDECIEAVPLKPIGDYMCGDENAEILHEERMKKFKETGTYTVGED